MSLSLFSKRPECRLAPPPLNYFLFKCSVAPSITFQSLFILCFQHWFFSKWHIFQFISVWSQMWISSTHIMLIRKSSRRCQKWGTIIIVTFYVFVKYSILGIVSSSRWIICFFNFLGFSICQVSTGKISEKIFMAGLRINVSVDSQSKSLALNLWVVDANDADGTWTDILSPNRTIAYSTGDGFSFCRCSKIILNFYSKILV